MEQRAANLLEEALGYDLDDGRVILIEDCVETSGAFLLHHLIKRSLAPTSSSSSGSIVVFVALSHPFSHYDRVLRKLGCNLSLQRQNGKFIFINDFISEKKSDNSKEGKDSLIVLYAKIRNAMEANALPKDQKIHATLMIDDASLLEVAAHGSSSHVADFMHYCHTLTSDFGCSLVIMNHEDIYSCIQGPTLLRQMEYLAHVLIRVEPLATGLAADVHGQLTVLNKGLLEQSLRLSNFHFKIKENCVEYFYPGSQV